MGATVSWQGLEGAGMVVRVGRADSPSSPARAFGPYAGGPAQAGLYQAEAEIERFFDGRAKAAPRGTLVTGRRPGGCSTIEEAPVHLRGGIAVKR